MKYIFMLLVSGQCLGQPKYTPLYRFDTLIYQYTIPLEPGQRVTFPAGCHLYEVDCQSRSGSLQVIFSDGSALYQQAIHNAFYMANTHSHSLGRLVHLRYGDRNWQTTQSAKTIQSITAFSNANFQLTYFTLTPLGNSPSLSSNP